MMVASGERLTPTEKRFLSLLSDLQPHDAAEFLALLNDDLGCRETVRSHFKSLRAKLNPAQDVVCEIHIQANKRTVTYRLVDSVL